MIFISILIIQNINSQFYVVLFVEYYLRGFRKYLVCVQNILQTDESTIICMIFGLNTNTNTNTGYQLK